MKMTMGELRDLIVNEIYCHDKTVNYQHVSPLGSHLMKRWADLFNEHDYKYVSLHYDSEDGASWSAVIKDGEKAIFELDDSLCIRDEVFDWLLIEHVDLASILNSYTTNTKVYRMNSSIAMQRLWDDIRFLAIA